MIPAVSALLSLLALKLLDKERRSHVNDFACDEALGLFAGLNVPPKKSFLTEYSYRCTRSHQRALLLEWIRGLSGLLFEQPEAFSLDFHPIPYRGEPEALETHYIPLAGKARPSVLSFFALEQESRVLCYANANLTRTEQSGAVMRFVRFWHDLTGSDPSWLYFDSKVANYAERNRLDDRDISFITIRRRGESVVRRLRSLPASAWRGATIDTPKRRHQKIRYLDEWVRLRDYKEEIRQVAVDGLGHERPTLLISNNEEESARNLVIRYASRNRVEDGLGSAVNFFHLDCLSSEVRLNVDLDAVMTVLANGCYRWLGESAQGVREAPAEATVSAFRGNGGAGRSATGSDRGDVRPPRPQPDPVRGRPRL